MADPKVGTGKKPKGSGRRLYTDENPKDTVGIGEHPQHIDEVDKLIEKIANAQEKLKELQHYKL